MLIIHKNLETSTDTQGRTQFAPACLGFNVLHVNEYKCFKFGFIGLSEAAPAKELEGLGQSLLSREQLPSQGRGERNFGV
jgi:hypothetical protein